MSQKNLLWCVLLVLFPCGVVSSGENPRKMPREDVIHVPAVGEGLFVSNTFQTNMVLQRDKPVKVWGWAEPGEQVTVDFAGEQATAEACREGYNETTLGPDSGLCPRVNHVHARRSWTSREIVVRHQMRGKCHE